MPDLETGDSVTAAIELAVSDLSAVEADNAPAAADTVSASPAAPDSATPATPAPSTPDPVSVAAGTADDERELSALEQELVASTPGLAKGRISVSRHQAVLTRARRQAEQAVAEAKAAAAKYETPEFQQQVRALGLAETRPEVFFRDVLLQDPRYKALVDAHVQALTAKATPAPAATAPSPAGNAERPAPDRLEADGTLGYTAEGAQQLLEWALARERQTYESKLTELQQRLDPILTERKHVEAFRSAVDRMRPIVADARTNWPGFEDHRQEILAEIKKPGNERMSIHDAYRAVVVPKLAFNRQQEEAKLRKEILDQLNAKQPSSVVPPGTPRAAADGTASTSDTVEDIVRNAYRTLAAA